MKLPKLNANHVIATSATGFSASRHGIVAGDQVFMQNIFGDIGGIFTGALGKGACVLRHAGAKGVECFTRCGTNRACLVSCAGPTLVQSIFRCL